MKSFRFVDLAMAAGLSSAFAGGALATTLSPLEPPIAAAQHASLTMSEIDTSAELLVVGSIDRFDGVDDPSGATLSMLFGYGLHSPFDGANGAFTILDGMNPLFSGLVINITSITGGLELELDNLQGEKANAFAPTTVARIRFDTELGDDVLGFLNIMDAFPVSVEIGRLPYSTVNQIPLPASLPLLAAALGLFALVRRRRGT